MKFSSRGNLWTLHTIKVLPMCAIIIEPMSASARRLTHPGRWVHCQFVARQMAWADDDDELVHNEQNSQKK